jgi:hypothetical protein
MGVIGRRINRAVSRIASGTCHCRDIEWKYEEHVIFNEEAFLSRTGQPKIPPSHSSSSSTSGSGRSQNSPPSLERRKTKRGRSSQLGGTSNRPSSRDSRKSAPFNVPNHEIQAKPNTDRVSRFFRKSGPFEKSTDTTACLERSQRAPAKDRERYSSPPWEIDWGAEGLPASPGCSQEPQSPIEHCKDDTIDAILSGEKQHEDPASASAPAAPHDVIEADSRLEDAVYVTSARPTGDSIEPFPCPMTSTELRWMNDIETLQLDTHTPRYRRHLTLPSGFGGYPARSNTFHLTAPAMRAYRDVDRMEPEDAVYGPLCYDHLQVTTDDELPPEELDYRQILSSTRIQNEQPSLAPESCSSITTGQGPDVGGDDSSYPLSHVRSFGAPYYSLAIRDSAPLSITLHSEPKIYGVRDESASDYKQTGQQFYGQDYADDHSSGLCGLGMCHTWRARPNGEEPPSSQAADEVNLQVMNSSPQILDSEPLPNDIDNGQAGHLFSFDFVKQCGQSGYLNHQENQEYQESGIYDCGVLKRDFDIIESVEPHPPVSDCDEGNDMVCESHQPCPAALYSYEDTFDEAFNAPTSANSCTASGNHTTDIHRSSRHHYRRRDTRTPSMKSSTFHAERSQSPLSSSRSPSPPNLRAITHTPFQQGRALLLGIEAAPSSSSVHLRQGSFPDNPPRYMERPDQDHSILQSVAQELERNGYWGSGDPRRCR